MNGIIQTAYTFNLIPSLKSNVKTMMNENEVGVGELNFCYCGCFVGKIR
jgi:hypothetical protein